MLDFKLTNIETTNLCNYKCPVCVNKGEKRSLRIEELKLIVQHNIELIRNQNIWLHLGGEPLVDKNFFEKVKMLANANARPRISTNGYLLNKGNNIKKIVSSELTSVVISLMTLDRKQYIKLHGCDNLEIVKNNVLTLKEEIVKNNSPIKLQVVALAPDDEMLKTFLEFSKTYEIEVGVHNYSSRTGNSRYRPSYIKEKGSEKETREPCECPFKQIIIKSNCDVVCCTSDLIGANPLGNLYDYDFDLEAIFNNDKYKLIREEQLNGNYNGICQKCTDWKYHQGKESMPYVYIYNGFKKEVIYEN